MKKAEITLVALALIAIITGLFDVPGSDIVVILAAVMLAAMYKYLGTALYNGIRFRRVFNRESYTGNSALRIVGAVLGGMAMSVAIIGMLFHYLRLPGVDIMLWVGLVGLLIALIVGLVKYQSTRARFYANFLRRVMIVGVLACITAILPRETWLEMRYSNHPDYIEAVKASWAELDNETLKKQVEIEEQLMWEGN